MKIIEEIVERIEVEFPRLSVAIAVVKSFFTRCHTAGVGRILPVKVFRQYTSYSCCASVAQTVLHYYGVRVSHPTAIKLTKCKPDGASLSFVARMLKHEFGLRPKRLKSKRDVRAALKRGEPVISNDALTYIDDHAILVVGQTPKGFYVADSVVGQIRWKHEDRFMAGASEWIAVGA